MFWHAFLYCSLLAPFFWQTEGCPDVVWFTVLSYHMHQGCVQNCLLGSPHFGVVSIHLSVASLHTYTAKTSPSSQASESSQRPQQANMTSKQNEEGIPSKCVAECVRANRGKSLNVHCIVPFFKPACVWCMSTWLFLNDWSRV